MKFDKACFPMSAAARKYPDVSQMSALEEELGFTMDPEFLEGQRAALTRIQSERLCCTTRENRLTIASDEARPSRSMSPFSACSDPRDKMRKDCGTEFQFSPEEIQEQRRIYEQLQAEDNDTKCNAQHGKTDKVTTFKVIRPNKDPSSFPLSTTDLDGRVVSLRSGKKVRITSESEVYKDISRGDAILVKCINCASFLQVGKKTVNVFCPVCQSVSPINCGGLQSVSPQIDLELASSLQIQENDAVRVRIQKKLSQSER